MAPRIGPEPEPPHLSAGEKFLHALPFGIGIRNKNRYYLDTLKAIAEALLEYETLDTSDIDVLMGGGKIERKPPLKRDTTFGGKKEPAAEKPAAKLPSFFPGRPKEEPEPA